MRALIAVLLLPLVAAHGGDHGGEFVLAGQGTLPSIGISIDAQQIAVHPEATAWVDIVVFIGQRNATTPDEWYVVHVGNQSMAIDRHGAVQDFNGTIARNGGGGDCVVVAGQTWERRDSQRVVLDAIPAGTTDLWSAWGDGDRCIDSASAAPADGAKDSPLPFVIVTIALLCVAAMRRR